MLGLAAGVSRAGAVDYVWTNLVSGAWTVNSNWEPASGNPSTSSDSAIITNAGGGAYTVALNTTRTIQQLLLNHSNATLTNTTAGLVSIASGGALTVGAGTIRGSYSLTSAALNLNPGATPSGAATFTFNGLGNLFSGGIGTGQTVVSRLVSFGGQQAVTSAVGFVNSGTLHLNSSGFNGEHMNFTVLSGTITNLGFLRMQHSIGGGSGQNNLSADVFNSQGATVSVVSVSSSSAIQWIKTGGNYENRGLFSIANSGNFRITGASSVFTNRGTLTVSGNGTFTATGADFQFTQQGSAAVLDTVAGMFRKEGLTSAGTLTFLGGKVNGRFDLERVNLYIAPSVSSTNLSLTFRTTAGSGIQVTNTIGGATRKITELIVRANSSGNYNNSVYARFTNAISLNANIQLLGNTYAPAGAWPTLEVTSGALTNHGTLLFSAIGVHNSGGRLIAALVNYGTVTSIGADAGNSASKIEKSGGLYQNYGVITLGSNTTGVGHTFTVNGSVLQNAAGGVIRGVTRTDSAAANTQTLTGSAVLDNQFGTIEARGGAGAFTFRINSALHANTSSGNSLLGGTWRVVDNGFGTTLNVVNAGGGNITALTGAQVLFDGANANFIQLESATGRLRTIGSAGALTLLSGKTFTATNWLSSAGSITVGSSSVLNLGAAGTGIMTNTGWLGGSGVISGSVANLGGTMAPGNSPGTLTIVGDHTFGDNSLYEWEIGPGSNDIIDVTGLLTFGSGLKTLRLIDLGGTLWTNQSAVLFTYGSLASVADATNNWNFEFVGGRWVHTNAYVWVDTLNQQVLLSGVGLIPEPSTLLLFLAGGVAIWRWCRK